MWNNGLRVTAVGGEDSISNLQRSKLVGSVRTYVCTDNRGLTMDGWFGGLRAGHAFVSTGPLVELTVNDMLPGETVALPAGGGAVDVAVSVRSITPLETVAVIFNGEVVEEISLDGDRRSVDFRRSFTVTRSGWYHLRAEGNPSERYPLDVEFAQAFTNPVWVTVDGAPVRNRAAAEYSIRWIDKLQQMATEWPGWRSQAEIDHVFAQFEEARSIYRRFAEEATSQGGPSAPAELPVATAPVSARCR